MAYFGAILVDENRKFDFHPGILAQNALFWSLWPKLGILGAKCPGFIRGFWLLRGQGGTFCSSFRAHFSSGKMSPDWLPAISFGNCDRKAIPVPSGPDTSQGSFFSDLKIAFGDFGVLGKRRSFFWLWGLKKGTFEPKPDQNPLTRILAWIGQIQSPR